MKNWKNISIIFLTLATGVAIYLAILAQSAANASTNKLANAEVIASQTVSALQMAQATANSDLATSSAIQATADVRLSKASTAQARLSTQVADLLSQLRIEQQKVSSYEKTTMCKSAPITIDYAGNSAVSNSLKSWLEDTQGMIEDVSWDIVWSNSKTSIHKLTGEYLYVYIVYFNETTLGNKNSIYDVNNQCWLDR